MARFKKYVFLSILLIAFLLCLHFQVYDYLTFTYFKKYQTLIQAWTMQHATLSILLYTISFTLLIACTIPCASFYALLGGFLFGSLAIIYAESATVFGGYLLFLAVRTSFGSEFLKKRKGWIRKMEQGFKKNAFYYLLSLRLMPILPCWISNISAGMLNVPTNTFLAATLLGTLPATCVYVLAGRSLDEILTNPQQDIKHLFLSPSIFLPLFALALLSLFPVVYRWLKKPKRRSE